MLAAMRRPLVQAALGCVLGLAPSSLAGATTVLPGFVVSRQFWRAW